MPFDPLAAPPMLTADLPGIGGRIRVQPEDFDVEEIPAYAPMGEGEYLYLWIEKREMGAEYFMRQIAKRLEISPGDVGTAGLKDRHAVTRQMVSVPISAEAKLSQLEGDGIRVLQVSRHNNKLKSGHLHGNRFRILIRDVHADTATYLPPLVERLRSHGMPNFYGEQRFGRGGETVLLGFTLLRGQPTKMRNPFLRKLALSAMQSALFNHYLTLRLHDGLFRQVIDGDVMAKWPFGGMFVTEDTATEQRRFDAREIVSAGPIYGRKTFPSRGNAAEREAAVLRDADLTTQSFNSFGKLLQGTRRHNLVYIDDLQATIEPEGVRCNFTLPAGSYATVLLREMMKTTLPATDEPAE